MICRMAVAVVCAVVLIAAGQQGLDKSSPVR